MRVLERLCVILILSFLILDCAVFGVYKSSLKSWERTDDSIADLIYISTNDIAELLSAFTFCFWYKQPSLQVLIERNGCGIASTTYIYSVQIHGYNDAMYLYVPRITPSNIVDQSINFVVIGTSVTVAENPAYPFYDSWMHICSGWNDTGMVRMAVKYSGAETYDVSEVDSGRTSPIPTSTSSVEGAWLMFQEQDSGSPYGSINIAQCSYGEIAGVQLFSTLLSLDEIKATGCGVRADIFDSEYENWTTVGSIPMSELEGLDFCSDKWRPYEGDESPDAGMYFSVIRDILFSPQIPISWPSYLVSEPNPLHCFSHCNDQPGCRGWILNKAERNCTLISNFDFMNLTMIPFIEVSSQPGTDVYYLDQLIF